MIDLIWGDHLIVVASVAKQSRLWIYPCGARKLGKIITATPLVATGLRARTNINGLWIYG